MTLDTVMHTPAENAYRILGYLAHKGFVRDDRSRAHRRGNDSTEGMSAPVSVDHEITRQPV